MAAIVNTYNGLSCPVSLALVVYEICKTITTVRILVLQLTKGKAEIDSKVFF